MHANCGQLLWPTHTGSPGLPDRFPESGLRIVQEQDFWSGRQLRGPVAAFRSVKRAKVEYLWQPRRRGGEAREGSHRVATESWKLAVSSSRHRGAATQRRAGAP